MSPFAARESAPEPLISAPDLHGRAPEAVRLDRVSRHYRVGGTIVRALDDVTLHIHRGEFVSLMGPSGSGKSTLLNVVGCLDTPTSGEVWIEGEPVHALSESHLARIRQRRIGFVFQSFQLVPRMTAARNVELPLVLAGVDPSERRERVERALERVGLGARGHHRPDQLSGGECQRVAIARAMILEPHILLADEPTGNLDTRTGAGILELLEGMHRAGLTIVLVTHDPSIGTRAERLLSMRDGRLFQDVAATLEAAARATGAAPGGERAHG